MTREALKQTGLDNKAVVKCKNMFALGICFYLYDRPEAYAYKYLETKFARKNPVVAEANKLAIDAGYNYAANTNQFTTTPWPREKGTYRTIRRQRGDGMGPVRRRRESRAAARLRFVSDHSGDGHPRRASPSARTSA